ncbi:MAG: CRISPR-associated helicase Cas3' [Gammaproteobacteria bacterium]|nr:CRISPR-associated helicase Cas3' [Gammaproteobacteria bacterium]
MRVTLLHYLAAAKTPVVLLSATLPPFLRDELAEAFCKGAAETPFEKGNQSGYPLITLAKEGEVEQLPIAADGEPYDLHMECMGSAKAHEQALQAARNGACVCIICNTAASAIRRYDALREKAPEEVKLHLFHAQFRDTERGSIEETVMTFAGRDSMPKSRRGQILIVTQVVEQSLDLDFDLMITELAPIDLVLQRAGRLWRHLWRVRPPGMDRRSLSVIVPQGERDFWWKGTEHVYRDGEKLQPSRDWLKKHAAQPLSLPKDIQRAVAEVYNTPRIARIRRKRKNPWRNSMCCATRTDLAR